MSTSSRTLLRLTGLVAAAALVPVAVVAPVSAAPHTSKYTTTSPVGWNGWRGVAFGTTFTAAHKRLGGSLMREHSTSGGCGDVLTTRTGTLDGNIYRRPHRVGNISVTNAVHYPFGIHKSLQPASVINLIHRTKYAVHGVTTTNPDGSKYRQDWVVGPQGHTFYFAYVDGMVERMGMAVNLHVARGQMTMNGC